MCENLGDRYCPAQIDQNLLNGVCTISKYDKQNDDFKGQSFNSVINYFH